MSAVDSNHEYNYVIWTLKNLDEKIGSTSLEIVETVSKNLGLDADKIKPFVCSALNRCIVFGEVKKQGYQFQLQPLEKFNHYLKRENSEESFHTGTRRRKVINQTNKFRNRPYQANKRKGTKSRRFPKGKPLKKAKSQVSSSSPE